MSRPGPGLTSTSPDRRQLNRSHPQTVGLIGPRLSRTADQRPSGAEPSADGVGRSTAAGTSSTEEEQQPRARTQNAPRSSRSKAAAGENRTRPSSLDPSPAARRAARHAERANPSATGLWQSAATERSPSRRQLQRGRPGGAREVMAPGAPYPNAVTDSRRLCRVRTLAERLTL